MRRASSIADAYNYEAPENRIRDKSDFRRHRGPKMSTQRSSAEVFRTVANARGRGFSAQSLSGIYGGLAVGHYLDGIKPPQNASIYLVNFDGAGTLKGAYTGTWQNAVITRTFEGTYTVLAEGSGRMDFSYTAANSGSESMEFVLVAGGAEINCLYTTQQPLAPRIATMVMKKQ